MDSNESEGFKMPSSTDPYFLSEVTHPLLSGDVSLTLPVDSKYLSEAFLCKATVILFRPTPAIHHCFQICNWRLSRGCWGRLQSLIQEELAHPLKQKQYFPNLYSQKWEGML